MKKLLLVMFILLLLAGCGTSKDVELNEINDNYRTMYEIFPISFADSDGDGNGDLQGIIDKLGYIDDLNFTGLWLTPICTSPTYHKYDVIDYKSIDPVLGTINDFDNLVKECHERDITIILDLVLNHTSNENPWFKEACISHARGRIDDKYYNYYNFDSIESGEAIPSGWDRNPYDKNSIYECRFWSGMPDLNLQAILDDEECNLAKDIEDIIKFWLIDHDVDGFRLDAVTSYFTGSQADNKKFLTWLNKTIKKYKEDAYVVGEASWDSNSNENADYQESGIDSFFEFANANASGYIGSAVKQQNASKVYSALKNNEAIANGGIEAVFVSNHDTGRMVGAVAGRTSLNNAKFGFGILQLLKGTTTVYYGDEIGMAVSSNATNNDPNKRLPIDWGDEYNCKNPEGTIAFKYEDCYPYGSVKEQQKDSNSLNNYVKKANLLRKEFKSLARGDYEKIELNMSRNVGLIKRSYEDETIWVAINASINDSATIDLSVINTSISIADELCVSGNAKLKSNKLTIPAQGIVILK